MDTKDHDRKPWCQGICRRLGGSVSGPLLGLFPAIIFLVGAFLAFATGTSWGTFGILIPIVVNIFSGTNHTMMIISISACMAGAVCGDHCSPISDTTIMHLPEPSATI